MRIATIFLFINLFFFTSVNGQILSASHTGLGLSLDVIVNVPENEVTLTLTGPETEWFAYGFGGNAMSGTYAIILENDNGTVITERELGFHAKGSLLDPSIISSEISTSNGNRTITLVLPIAGSEPYYSFPTSDQTISFIAAKGYGGTLEFHGGENYVLGNSTSATGLAFSSVVPVNWSYFRLSDQNGKSKLTWKTESEVNNAGFMIQRSMDAVKWQDLSFVDAQSELGAMYEFIDQKTIPGLNYYRLKQVDEDGTENYSVVKSIEVQGTRFNDKISLFPNPVTSVLNIEQKEASSGIRRIQIMDMNFRTLKDLIWEDERTSQEINVSAFTAGHYLITIKHSDWNYTSHFIKQ